MLGHGDRATVEPTYSTKEVARLVGVTYRQAHHWAQEGLIEGQPISVGIGRRRFFTPAQLRRVRVLSTASRLRSLSLGDLADQLEQGAIRWETNS